MTGRARRELFGRTGLDENLLVLVLPHGLGAAAVETVEAIRSAPFLPKHMPVHAALIDIRTGQLTVLEREYEAAFR